MWNLMAHRTRFSVFWNIVFCMLRSISTDEATPASLVYDTIFQLVFLLVHFFIHQKNLIDKREREKKNTTKSQLVWLCFQSVKSFNLAEQQKSLFLCVSAAISFITRNFQDNYCIWWMIYSLLKMMILCNEQKKNAEQEGWTCKINIGMWCIARFDQLE